MGGRRLGRGAVIALAMLVTGCEVYEPNCLSCPPPPLPDCGSLTGQVPCRPPSDPSHIEEWQTMSFALTDIQLDPSVDAGWWDIGLDLDGHDSQAPDFLGDCTPLPEVADGTNGIDNAFGGEFWPVVRSFVPSFECELHASHAMGQGTLLVQMTEWNGLPDDDQVRVELLPALDGTSDVIAASDCDAITQVGDSSMNDELETHELHDGDPGALRPPPLMDGHDYFCVNADGRTNGDASAPALLEDHDAYVAGGTIVARLSAGSEITLRTLRSSFAIRLNQGTLLLPLSLDYRTIEGGTLAGRFPLTALSQVGPELGICDPAVLSLGGGESYPLGIDILSNSDPNASGESDCDAMSVGVRFDGVRANIVGTSPSAVRPFYACDGVGPFGTPFVTYPVEACCASLPVSEVLDCDAHHASPP